MKYSWDWAGFGGTLTRLSDGASLWMQGDDACEFDDKWDSLDTDDCRDLLASEYDHVMELPDTDYC